MPGLVNPTKARVLAMSDWGIGGRELPAGTVAKTDGTVGVFWNTNNDKMTGVNASAFDFANLPAMLDRVK